MELAQCNAHALDRDIVFAAKGHKYTILTDPKTEYASVTGWVKTYFGEFCADTVIQKMMNGRNWKEGNKYWGMTPDEIKHLWDASGKLASTAGTHMHERIEHFMNRPDMTPGYTHAELYADYMNTTTPCAHAQEPSEWRWFIQFVHDTPHLKPYRTEWMVYDTRVAIAGSIDMVYENPDGSLSIYDWKRSKQIDVDPHWKTYSTAPGFEHVVDSNYSKYSMQLNVYARILQTVYEKKIKDLALVRLHPDSDHYELIPVPFLPAEMDLLFDARRATKTASAAAAAAAIV